MRAEMSPGLGPACHAWVFKLEGLTQSSLLPLSGTPYASLHSLVPGW